MFLKINIIHKIKSNKKSIDVHKLRVQIIFPSQSPHALQKETWMK